jgi:hypothetical protein
MDEQQHNDALFDAVALAEAETRGDQPGAAVITGNCDHAAVEAVLRELLIRVRVARATGGHVCLQCWRPWALEAMRQL